MARIEKARQAVIEKKCALAVAERALQQEVSKFLMMREGSLRLTAAAMGLSVQYLSDIIHGRRGVSAAVLDAVGKLK